MAWAQRELNRHQWVPVPPLPLQALHRRIARKSASAMNPAVVKEAVKVGVGAEGGFDPGQTRGARGL